MAHLRVEEIDLQHSPPMPPPPVYNHPHPQDYYSNSPGWHAANNQYPPARQYQPLGSDPRQYRAVDPYSGQYHQQLVSNAPHPIYQQSAPPPQYNPHAYYPSPPMNGHVQGGVQGEGWHRPHHDQEYGKMERWGGGHPGREQVFQQNLVRSSIEMVNQQPAKQGGEDWGRAPPERHWGVAHGRRQHTSSNSCSSSNTTSSTSSTETTKRPGLTPTEKVEYTALIKDLWRSARFAQEFKKYSVGDYLRVKELIDRLPNKSRPQ